MPEFDPPDNYDPLLLRGHHNVVFKVRLPSSDCSQEVKDLLAQIVQNEKENQDTYYAHLVDLLRKREADLDERMAKKRQKTE